MSKQNRVMRLGAFFHGIGHHIASWRHPSADPHLVTSLAGYVDMARTAERGGFDMIFLPDNLSVRESNLEALKHVSDYIVQFEPLSLLCALAPMTQNIGLLATASTSYNEPYHLARRLASLDFLSAGRAGWNLVTSTTDAEARNFGRDTHFLHAERYDRADEFAKVIMGLWDSWEDDAFPRNAASGLYCDTSKLHVLDHQGKHFQVRGPLNIERPPQGYPVIAQAGSSTTGMDLAARVADLIYTMQTSLKSGQEFYTEMKRQVRAAGRHESDLLIMPGVVPVVGRTDSEAQEKFEELQELVDPVVGLSQLSAMFPGFDFSSFDVDGPLPDIPEGNGIQSRQKLLVDMARKDNLSIKQLYLKIAGGRSHWVLIGSPTHIADQLEERFVDYAADGFNIMPFTQPGGLNDFVDLVVPELRKRGLVNAGYAPGTLREKLGLPRPQHPAHRKTAQIAAAE
ncbi:LLM class flavin-dependent oxidoreductase [Chelatococcus sp. GCM10030263]|uniref:LLM class flavin-dependent oxidoreductase n=1 Tax=Chelatococcus sp. GCM10030263 TaxID=3273387 RepID=UPI00360D64A1